MDKKRSKEGQKNSFENIVLEFIKDQRAFNQKVDNRLDKIENRLDVVEQDLQLIKSLPTISKKLNKRKNK